MWESVDAADSYFVTSFDAINTKKRVGRWDREREGEKKRAHISSREQEHTVTATRVVDNIYLFCFLSIYFCNGYFYGSCKWEKRREGDGL